MSVTGPERYQPRAQATGNLLARAQRWRINRFSRQQTSKP
jgi:hypothetical protein